MIICSHLNNCCKKITSFLKTSSNTSDSNDDRKRKESILQYQQMSQSDLEKAPSWDPARKSSIFGGSEPRTFQQEKRQSTKIKRKQTGWIKGNNPLSKKYYEDSDDDDEDDDTLTSQWNKSKKLSNVYVYAVSGSNKNADNSIEHQIYSISVQENMDKKESNPFDRWKNIKYPQVYSASVPSQPTNDFLSNVSGRPKPYTSSKLKYIIFIPTSKKGRKSSKQKKAVK